MAARRAAHAAFVRSAPAPALLAGIAAALGTGPARRVVRLTGGLVAATHRVEFDSTAVVVRQFDPADRERQQERLTREVAVLAALAATPVPAPEVLLADPDGRLTGGQVVVLTLLPGRSVDPPDDVLWARRLAEGLATVHDQEPMLEPEPWVDDWLADPMPDHLVGTPRADAVWAAIVATRDDLAAEPRTLTHHDFHPGNTLWLDGRLTGIVDWGHGGAGFAAADAAYCGLDLTLCKGPRYGERFLRAYREVVGRPLAPGWRAVAATRAMAEVDDWVDGYRDLGIAVTVVEARRRLAGWIDDALRRLGVG